MNVPSEQHQAPSVMTIGPADTQCLTEGCDGSIVRHSLGAAQSVRRCTRCFRRYERSAGAPTSALHRFVQDFITWRE